MCRNQIHIVLLLMVAVALMCCNKRSSTQLSSDPTITKMAFTANDSFPGLAKASFTIVSRHNGDTGLIYSNDSLMFGTDLKHVVPVFSYNASPYSVMFHVCNDTVDTAFLFNSGSAVDFRQYPMYVTTTSADRSAMKTYEIQVVVHEADPDLFTWQKLSSEVCTESYDAQKAFVLNDRFYYIFNGLQQNVYQSADAKTWEKMTLTDTMSIGHLVVGEKYALCLDGGRVKKTADIQLWESVETDFSGEFIAGLMYFDERYWALAQVGEQRRLVYSEDGTKWEELGWTVPDDFPVEQFGAVSFFSTTGRPRALILGGYDSRGYICDGRWSFEWSVDGYRVVNLSDQNSSSYDPIAGAELFYYNNSLYLMGGMQLENKLLSEQMMVSTDEGMHWEAVDTAHNKFPLTIGKRYCMSATLRNDTVYVFGGKDQSKTYSDTYSGVLNSVMWER